MKAVITVVGKDRIGILAMMANICADHMVNIMDVSQTIVDEIFTMTMIVDLSKLTLSLADFADHIAGLGKEQGLVIRLMNYDVFESMHRI